MGFALIVEADPYAQQYPLEEVYRYLNGEMYISYLHLPQSARGDHTIKYRKGSFMFLGLLTFRIVLSPSHNITFVEGFIDASGLVPIITLHLFEVDSHPEVSVTVR